MASTVAGTPDSGSVTIANTLPVASGASITQARRTVSDTLTCSYAYFDADGDADESTISLGPMPAALLRRRPRASSGAHSRRGGSASPCTVTPADDEDSGCSPVKAEALRSGTLAPSVTPAATISPAEPSTDTGVCSITDLWLDTSTMWTATRTLSTVEWSIGSTIAGTPRVLSSEDLPTNDADHLHGDCERWNGYG